MQISAGAKSILEKLNASGFDAYLVGGCVRDSLMGLSCHDYDITTNALPFEISQVFSGNKIIDVGIKHGTVTVIIDSEPFEITTFRKDGEYKDNRHPENVTFSNSLAEDLSRRDFTVNSICYNPNVGYIDLFDGRNDINNKIIKTVGNLDKRFNEDALRILRALRFSAVLGFEIDKKTSLAIHKNAHLLKNISAERITSELMKMLVGVNIFQILMEYFDVFSIIIPEIAPMYKFDQRNKYHKYDLWEHTCHVVDNIKNELPLRLAALLHDIGKPQTFFENETGGHFYGHAHVSYEMTSKILTRLKFDNKTKAKVEMLVRYHDGDIEPEVPRIKKMLSKFGNDFFDLIELKKADTLAQADFLKYRIDELALLEKIANEILSTKPCLTLKDLAVNGNDLIALGYTGREVGEILKEILDLVIAEKLENNIEEIIKHIKNASK